MAFDQNEYDLIDEEIDLEQPGYSLNQYDVIDEDISGIEGLSKNQSFSEEFDAGLESLRNNIPSVIRKIPLPFGGNVGTQYDRAVSTGESVADYAKLVNQAWDERDNPEIDAISRAGVTAGKRGGIPESVQLSDEQYEKELRKAWDESPAAQDQTGRAEAAKKIGAQITAGETLSMMPEALIGELPKVPSGILKYSTDVVSAIAELMPDANYDKDSPDRDFWSDLYAASKYMSAKSVDYIKDNAVKALDDYSKDQLSQVSNATENLPPGDLRRGALIGSQSLAHNVATMAGGVALRSPIAATMGLMFADVAGNESKELEKKWNDPNVGPLLKYLRDTGYTSAGTLAIASLYGGAEIIVENKVLRKLFGKWGGNWKKELAKFIAYETGQESLTEGIQAGLDKITKDPDMTWGQFVDRYKDLYASLPIAIGGTAALGRGIQATSARVADYEYNKQVNELLKRAVNQQATNAADPQGTKVPGVPELDIYDIKPGEREAIKEINKLAQFRGDEPDDNLSKIKEKVVDDLDVAAAEEEGLLGLPAPTIVVTPEGVADTEANMQAAAEMGLRGEGQTMATQLGDPGDATAEGTIDFQAPDMTGIGEPTRGTRAGGEFKNWEGNIPFEETPITPELELEPKDKPVYDKGIDYVDPNDSIDLNLDLVDDNNVARETPKQPNISGELVSQIDELRTAANETKSNFVKAKLNREADILQEKLKGKEPKLTKEERAKKRKTFDSTTDDLQNLIRKSGGINVDLESDWAGRLKSSEVPAFGLSSMEQTNGKGLSLDYLLERANEEGFNFADVAALEEALGKIERGESVYSTHRSDESIDYEAIQNDTARFGGGENLTQEQINENEIGRLLDENLYEEDIEPGDEFDRTPQEGRRVLSATVENENRTVDRRRKSNARQIYESMPREQLIDIILQHELTGIKGLRSLVEDVDMDWVNYIISIDADGLKFYNDNMGHEVGDDFLQYIADALDEVTDHAYHKSGDEFFVLAETVEEANKVIEDVNALLKYGNQKVTNDDGVTVEVNGYGITAGIGETINEADKAMGLEKDAREKRGERSGRGEIPVGVTATDANGNKLDTYTKKEKATSEQPGVNAEAAIKAEEKEQPGINEDGSGKEQVVTAEEITAAASQATGHIASKAQIESGENGNFKKGHISDLQGFKISIENKAGTKRNKMTPAAWPALAHNYGDITGTESSDGDPLDVFVKKDVDIPADNPIYVINQNDKSGKFDETKTMFGFDSAEDAKKGYLDSYSDDFTGFGDITEVTPAQLREWIDSGDTAKKYEAKEDFDLTGQTEAEILADEQAAADAKQKEAEADKKAEADAGVDEFKLTGSEREADLAAAAGQEDLLAQKPDETKATKILDAANITGKDRLDVISKFRAGEYSLDDLNAAYPAEPKADKSAKGAQKEPEPAKSGAQDIQDFGSELKGAAKHYAAAYAEKMKNAKDIDISSVPLSKAWPEPNYQRLIDEGADPWAVAFIRSARDMVPSKPRKGWRVKQYVQQAEMLRGLSEKVINTPDIESKIIGILQKDEYKSLDEKISTDIELYLDVGHEKSLKGIDLVKGEYSLYKGKKYDPTKTIYTVEKKSKGGWPTKLADGNTKQEALDSFKKAYNSLDSEKQKSKETKFDIYSYRGKTGVVIGKKIGKDYVDLEEFETSAEARKYLEENHDKLVKKLAKFKVIPNERRTENEPRIGDDHRNGADITTEQFKDAFGFRGGQFGNTVLKTKGEAQQKLNEAYDALMDLAGILGVPPKALSLNGELGLAFGARGKGGKNAASADYEPNDKVTDDRVIINLTRKRGAGSLAHEFFHALDNYFTRMRGDRGIDRYLTENPYHDGKDGVRPKTVAAFKQVVDAIDKTGLAGRSNKLDAKRTKAYWATVREMAARSFESYVVAKLQDQGKSNDFLANIVDETYWKATEDLGMELEGSYPYPDASEINDVRAAFDNLFEALEAKETDKDVMLFSKTSRTPNGTAKGITNTQVNEAIAKFKEELGLPADVEIITAPNKESIMDAESLAKYGNDQVRGFYLDRPESQGGGAIVLVESDIDSVEEAIEVLRHEWLVHHGLNTFSKADKKKIINRILSSKGEMSLKKAWKYVQENYPEANSEKQAEELLAYMGEKKATRLSKLWNDLVLMVQKILRKMGWKNGVTTKADIVQYIEDLTVRVGAGAEQQTFEGQPAYSKDPATGEVGSTFYSQMQGVLNNKLPNKGAPQQMRLQVKAIVDKGGIKKEEYEWSGINDWFNSLPAGKITKQEVLDFLKANEIQIEEVEKGATTGSWAVWHGEMGEEYYFSSKDDAIKFAKEEDITVNDESVFHKQDSVDTTKYSGYTVPGGENYKELLLTLPESDGISDPKNWDEAGLLMKKHGISGDQHPMESDSEAFSRIGKEVRKKDRPKIYTSAHWDEANILAFVRYDERVDADGNKVLFLEEVQSDWHQGGRSNGYNINGLNVKAARDALVENMFYSQSEIDSMTDSEIEEATKEEELFDNIQAGSDGFSVPNAPFKTTWPMLATKRMIRMAAENGFDSIAWTTGEMQNERYDLSKKVDFIDVEVDKNSPDIDRTVHVVLSSNASVSLDSLFVDSDGKVIDVDGDNGFIGKHLSDIIGKEVSEKIMEVADKKRIQGNDLKVGGTGMIKFYDQMLPSMINKYVKKWGSKVNKAKIEVEVGGDKQETEWMRGKGYLNTAEVHNLPITQSMKSAAMQGQVMFSKKSKDQTKTPAFKKWFGDSKVVDDNGEPLVVYHGTDVDVIDAFDMAKSGKGPSKVGFWFSDDGDFSKMFGKTLIETYVSINNPKIISQDKWNDLREDHGGDVSFWKTWREGLIESGFDGVIVKSRNIKIGKFDVREPAVISAFYSTQIKSAIGNIGTFDPNDPRISFSKTKTEPSKENKTVEKGIEGKTIIEAVDFIIKKSPDKSYRVIAKAVKKKIEALQDAGVEFSLNIGHVGEMVPNALINSNGFSHVDFNSNKTTVWLQGADAGTKTGMTYMTVLHEIIHAATQTSVYLGNMKSQKGTEIGNSVADLYKVANYIIRYGNDRYSEYKKGNIELTEFEEQLHRVRGINNATQDVNEIIAWGLTSKDFQEYLEGIEYKTGKTKKSLWKRFVSAVRKALGLSAFSETALSEVIRVSKDIIDAPVNELLHYAKGSGIQLSINTSDRELLSTDVAESSVMFSKRTPKEFIKETEGGVKDRAKSIKKWYVRNLTKEGGMPDVAFDALIKADAAKMIGESDLSFYVKDFEKNIKEAYGVKYNKMTDEDLNDINSYLAGDKGVALPKGLHRKLDHMRDYIDQLSDSMMVTMTDMLKIEAMKLSDKESEAFGRFLSDENDGYLPKSMQKHWNLYQTIKKNKGVYLNRSYEAFDNEKWIRKVKMNLPLIKRAQEFILKENPELTHDQVVGAVNAILEKAYDNGNFMTMISKGAKAGSKDTSILNKKKDVPDVIRELLGEYKDPKLNFVRTATNMQWFIANHNFLMSLRSDGFGVFLFTKPVGDFSVKIIAEGSESMNPIDGLYTTREIDDALRDATEKETMSDFMRTVIKYNSLIKYNKTILSVTTQARNFQSAAGFAVLNGHFKWFKHGGKAARVAHSDIFSKNEEWRSYINDLISRGVIHNSPYARELKAALEEFSNIGIYQKGKLQGARKFLDFMQRTYQVGDDFWKIIGYENEVEIQTRFNIKQGMNKAEAIKAAKDKAAYRIRNGYPTYSMVPRSIKKLRRFPLVGTFVSFPWEIGRTAKNAAGFIKEDYQDGNTEAYVNRAVGMAIMAGASYAISIGSMMLLGLGSDDDEAVRKLLPPWSKNSQLVYTGYDKNGEPTYYDLSYLDPYTYIKKPISALVNGNNEGFDEKIEDSMIEILSPFLGVDIGAGVLLEIQANKKRSGGQVYNEQAPRWDKLKQMLNHFRKAVQPGTLSNIERMILAVKSESTRSGKRLDIGDEMFALAGHRTSTLNIPTALVYKSYQFIDDKREASRLLSYVSGSAQKITKAEIKDATTKMLDARGKIYKEMIKIVGAAKKLNTSEDDIAELLEAAGVSSEDVDYLLDGEVAPWDMPFSYGEKGFTRAILTAKDAEQRREIEEEYDKHINTIDEVLNDWAEKKSGK